MKRKSNLTISFICMLSLNMAVVFSQNNSYSISGVIYDLDKQSIQGATVILLKKGDNNAFKGTAAVDGEFQLNQIPSGEYILKVSFIGYQEVQQNISVMNHDIKNIEIILEEDNIGLSEIVITAKTVEQFADRSTYRLTESDRNSFSNALSVLDIVPKLQVLDLSLSTVDGKTVKVLINGINSDETDLSVISTQDIARIEYYENPPLRFAAAGLGAVVNVVTKKMNNGGVVGLNLQNAFTTGYGNDVASFKYNFNNSQIAVKYDLNYRDSDKRFLDENIDYLFDGQDYKKQKKGIDGLYQYRNQQFEVGFINSKADDYVFSSKFSCQDYYYNRESEQSIKQFLPDYLEKVGASKDKDLYTSSNLDLYFSKAFNSKHEILFNLVGTYFDSKYNYSYVETEDKQIDFDTRTDIEGDKYSFIGDLLYNYHLKSHTLTIGTKYFYGSSKQQMSSNSIHTNSNNNELLMYGEFVGKKDKLSYKVSAGMDHTQFNSKTLNKDYKFTAFKPGLSVSYDINKHSGLSFSYQMNTINPTLAQLSPSLYLVDHKYAYSGNPDLNPYNQHDLQVGYFYNKNSLLFGSFLSYSHANNPILPLFKEGSEYLIETLDNLNNSKNYKWGFNFRWFPFPTDIIRLGMYMELFHLSNAFYDVNWRYDGYRINPALIINYKKWNLMATYLSSVKTLSGQKLIESPSVSTIELSYKPIQNLTTTLAVRYPFYDAWKKSSETHKSAVVKRYELERVTDMANLVYVRLVYNFSFGKKVRDIKQKIENKDKDTGILTRPYN